MANTEGEGNSGSTEAKSHMNYAICISFMGRQNENCTSYAGCTSNFMVCVATPLIYP